MKPDPSEGGPGDWTKIAASIEPSMAAAGHYERRSVLDRAASEHRLTPQTIRRMVKAFQYVARHAPSVGLKTEEVRASVGCIEVLDRIERKRMRTDLALREVVFNGGYTFRQMLTKEKLLSLQWTPPDIDTTLDFEFVRQALSEFLLGSPSELRLDLGEEVSSLLVAALRVDLDLSIDDRQIGVFSSPRFHGSASQQRSLEETIVGALAGSYFFDGVILLAYDEEEARRVGDAIAGVRHGGNAPLQVLHLHRSRDGLAFRESPDRRPGQGGDVSSS